MDDPANHTHTMAKYTAYDIAKQLRQIRNNRPFDVSGFAELPEDVLSAFLWLTAEWRQVNEMKELLQMGANPHEEHEGLTVLEMFLQGHDGTWRCKSPSNTSETEAGVKMLFEYGVTCGDVKHDWILSNCSEIINNSEYLRNFFGYERVAPYEVWWFKPGSEKLTKRGEFSVDPVVACRWVDIPAEQFIYIVKKDGKYKRYIITKGFGDATVIPLTETPNVQKKLSWLTTTLMGGLDGPYAPGEDDSDADE